MLPFVFLFFKSMLIGVGMAAPLGPISMLLIKKTLENGLTAGFAIAVGAACADALYSGFAGFAMASFMALVSQHQTALRVVGKGVMACVLLSEMRFHPKDQQEVSLSRAGTAALCAKVFFMTLANPVTILAMSGIFLSFNIAFTGYEQVLIATAGVFTGSSLWCLSLSCLTAYSKRYMSSGFISGLQYVSLGVLAALIIFI